MEEQLKSVQLLMEKDQEKKRTSAIGPGGDKSKQA